MKGIADCRFTQIKMAKMLLKVEKKVVITKSIEYNLIQNRKPSVNKRNQYFFKSSIRSLPGNNTSKSVDSVLNVHYTLSDIFNFRVVFRTQ